MASPSSPSHKYDVFLSFRGADTRKGFMSFLFKSLIQNQIDTFMDTDLKRGEVISPSLLEKIEQSHISVVVFSQNYADSEWCMEELAKIHECMLTMGHVAFPVFYRVDPTHVQDLTGTYGAAMANHAAKFQDGVGLTMMENWRRALADISTRSGWASQDFESEAKLIDTIVSDVWKKLELLPPTDVDDDFVGIDSLVGEVESLLRLSDVNSLGIWGMGGIGKTAVVEKLYCKIYGEFEGHYFINVREELEQSTLVGLRNKIFSNLFEVGDQVVGTPSTLSMPIKRKLLKKRVLIILDDVTSHQQVEILVTHDQYSPGTKIIITSRDKQVLRKGCKRIYEVKKLSFNKAFQLFKCHAFRQRRCTKLLMEQSKRVVKYADGVPLALRILASKLNNKGVEEWEILWEKLTKVPDKDVVKVLQRSYDLLEDHEKSIFLHITCFFCGEEEAHVKRFLDACGLYANDGVTSLIDKSLIKISGNRLVMHDLVRQMGQDIVRKECMQDPGKRSRLYDPMDIYNVLLKKRVSDRVEGIALDMSKIERIEVSSTFFSGMHNLRLLHFYTTCIGKLNLHVPNGLESLPEELRFFMWYQYPLKSLPSNFSPINLVELHLPHSQVEQLWDSDQGPVNLKLIDLSNSSKLIRVPDMSRTPDLEVLNLQGCIKLAEIPSSIGCLRKLTSLTLDGCLSLQGLPSSIGSLRNLSYFSLAGCENLYSFPSLIELKNLTILSLNRCSKLTVFPEVPPNIEILNLGGTAIHEVPSSIGHLSRLKQLDFSYCVWLKSLPSSMADLKYLQQLTLEGCVQLVGFRDYICNWKSLESLHVTGHNSGRFMEDLGKLAFLKHLQIADSDITEISSSISDLSNLESLRLLRCRHLKLSLFRGFDFLKVLQIKSCGLSEIPPNLGSLTSLEELELSEENLKSIPSSIKQLFKLFKLSTSGCSRLQSIPELPLGLQVLDMCNCSSLRLAPSFIAHFSGKRGTGHGDFIFGNCFNLGKIESSKILDSAQQRIQCLAALLFGKEYEEMDIIEEEKSAARFHTFEVTLCLPENNVPTWFEHQHIGSSFTVTPNEHKLLDIRRLAFCAVVACNGRYDWRKFRIKCKCHLITKIGHHFNLDSCFSYPMSVHGGNPRWERNLLEYHHLFIWYSSNVFDAPEHYVAEACFEFYVVDREGNYVIVTLNFLKLPLKTRKSNLVVYSSSCLLRAKSQTTTPLPSSPPTSPFFLHSIFGQAPTLLTNRPTHYCRHPPWLSLRDPHNSLPTKFFYSNYGIYLIGLVFILFSCCVISA